MAGLRCSRERIALGEEPGEKKVSNGLTAPQDWNTGAIRYHTEPPAASAAVELVPHFAQAAVR